MALIYCPECRMEVSNKAPACPKCAYPISRLISLPQAILKRDLELVGDIIKSGADVNERTKSQNTPILIASAVGDCRIIQSLLSAGASPHAKNEAGETALDIARKKRRKEAIALLQGLLSEKTDSSPPQREDEGVVRIIKKTPSGEEVVRDFGSSRRIQGASLNCTKCAQPIGGADVTCPHCKILIVRRYCSRCKKLYPEHAQSCPHCGSSGQKRFRYYRHPEGYLTAGIALLIFSVAIAMNWEQPAGKPRLKAQSLSASAHPQPKLEKIVPRRPLRESETSFPSTFEARVKENQSEENTASPMETTLKPPIVVPEKESIPVTPAPQEQPERDTSSTESQSQRPPVESEPEPVSDDPVEPEVAIESDESETAVGSQEIEIDRANVSSRGRALNSLGYRLLNAGQPERAIPILYNALRSFPKGTKDIHYAYALFNLGRSLRLAGRPDLAIPILQERLKIRDQRQAVFAELDAAKRDLGYVEEIELSTE